MGVYNNLSIFKNIVFSSFLLTPYKINFAVTSQCNSRCKTCNTWKIKKDLSSELKTWEIDAFFKKLPRTITWLSLTGGEPFLRKDFADIINSAIRNIASLKMITIPSNGLLKKRVMSTLSNIPDFPIFMNFSIDGPEKVHDPIRGIKGAFRKTWDTHQSVLALSKKRKNLHVGIETTVSSYNINHLDHFIQTLLDSGNKVTLTFAQEGGLYSNVGMKEIAPTDENKIKKIIDIARRNMRIYKSTDYIEKIYLKKALLYLKNRDYRPKKCVAGISSISVNSFGNISPCLIWEKKLGNLRDMGYNLKNVDAKKIKEARKLINSGKCPNCWTPCEAYQAIIMDTFKLNWR